MVRRVRGRRKVSPRLLAELESEPEWMYPWQIAPGVAAPTHAAWLASIHDTRMRMIEKPVRRALAAAGGAATAIDLACNEGWFSHKLLDWGAARVIGVDIREVNIRRARLIATEFGLPADRLGFVESDIFDLRPSLLGKFDVVLNLGLIYHLENPVGALRLSRELTKTLCVVESSLHTHDEPIDWVGRGKGVEAGCFVTHLEQDADTNPLASQPGRISLVPNRAAVEEMATAAGFSSVENVPPPTVSDAQYVHGSRGVFLAQP
jgi:hypothetical protein